MMPSVKKGDRAGRPLLLLSNDDGFFAEGIRILHRRLRDVGRTFIVAPDRERSAASMAVTLRRPLRLHRLSATVWSLDGTPADCIYFALRKILPRRPDLLISGMNSGPNLGQQDVHYSGTVAAALQGTFLGIPSLAVSLRPDEKGDFHWGYAVGVVRHLARRILKDGLPQGITLNVNIPPPPVKGIRITKLGWKFYDPEIIEKKDPRDAVYYWIGTGQPRRVGDSDSDVRTAYRGFISITPLQTDLTAASARRNAGLRKIVRTFQAG